jgi:hypothetical protein
MTHFLAAFPLALQLISVSAESLPNLNVTPSCHAAAASEVETTDRMRTCVASEKDAHDQLVQRWAAFNAADRASCVESMMSFEPTYTELLTCLELAHDARKLPEQLY